MAAAAKGEMGSWVSDAAREKFMAAYERVLALWPQPVEALDLETTAATTRVNAYRPRRDGAPVVLLTGPGAAPRSGSRTSPRCPPRDRSTRLTSPATRGRASRAP